MSKRKCTHTVVQQITILIYIAHIKMWKRSRRNRRRRKRRGRRGGGAHEPRALVVKATQLS